MEFLFITVPPPTSLFNSYSVACLQITPNPAWVTWGWEEGRELENFIPGWANTNQMWEAGDDDEVSTPQGLGNISQGWGGHQGGGEGGGEEAVPSPELPSAIGAA